MKISELIWDIIIFALNLYIGIYQSKPCLFLSGMLLMGILVKIKYGEYN